MRKWLILLLIPLPMTLEAYQRIPVQERVAVTAWISATALNRIAIEHDRILSVKGTTGQFELEKDADIGQIFLKPILAPNRDSSDNAPEPSQPNVEPIHIFLSTENGRTYSVSLIPDERAAESIVLAPLDTINTWERTGAYESLLKDLIKALHTQTPLPGFEIQTAKIDLPKITGATVTHLQTYASHTWVGQILELKNTTKTTILLSEHDFYHEGVRAVSIVNPVLSAHDATRVYVVRK